VLRLDVSELESGAVSTAKGAPERFRSPLIEPDLPISGIKCVRAHLLRKSGPLGSVRGAPSNGRPYRERFTVAALSPGYVKHSLKIIAKSRFTSSMQRDGAIGRPARDAVQWFPRKLLGFLVAYFFFDGQFVA
jgi:hypothetical protein